MTKQPWRITPRSSRSLEERVALLEDAVHLLTGAREQRPEVIEHREALGVRDYEPKTMLAVRSKQVEEAKLAGHSDLHINEAARSAALVADFENENRELTPWDAWQLQTRFRNHLRMHAADATPPSPPRAQTFPEEVVAPEVVVPYKLSLIHI